MATPSIEAESPAAVTISTSDETINETDRDSSTSKPKIKTLERMDDILKAHAKHHKKPTAASLNKLNYITIFLAYWHFVVMITFSLFRELFRIIQKKWKKRNNKKKEYAPILDNTFFVREMYGRMHDLWFRPISSNPGGYMDVVDREIYDPHPVLTDGNHLKYLGTTTRALNLSSYNYLGFSQTSGPCVDAVIDTIDKWGTIMGGSRIEGGTSPQHALLEQRIASFVGKDDAIVFGMGFATNSTSLPSLCDKNTLILSDSLNHASIIVGCRSSDGATIKVFKHNNPVHLEAVLKKAIIQGQPRTHLPWSKILIITEGIFSMEGEILRLPEIVALKKKYNAYLWVDEAHSIGALGPLGKGVCDYWGVDPADVDVLMGTFTKSFAAVGGYIAADKGLIDYLRATAFSSVYDCSLAPPMAQQIISSLGIINGDDGTNVGKKKLNQLRDNIHRFRSGLIAQGFDIIGDDESPVVVLMIYILNKMPALSRLCLENNIGIVVVCYPATDLMLCRARFCISAAHSTEDIELAVKKITEIGEFCMLQYHDKAAIQTEKIVLNE